jgi:hypothetical protein
VLVRSPRTDRFAAGSWWSSREQSREVLTESLRWINSLLLGDLWAGQSPGAERVDRAGSEPD